MTALVGELGGLRALARSLARDDADDLVQDTAVAALAHPPALDRPVRPWLATVLRNQWRMDRRGGSRRAAREAISEPPAEAVMPDAALDRARTLERLAAALVALDEPFREAVVLRFVDGRAAVDIARALGVPDSTVRWRIQEGLARLRATLDHQAPRRVWRRGMIALAGVPGPATAAASSSGAATTTTFILGAGIMKGKSIAIGVVLIFLLLGGALVIRHVAKDDPAAAARAADGAVARGLAAPVSPGLAPAMRASANGDVAAAPPEIADPLPGQGRAEVEIVDAPGGGFAGRVINWSTGEGVGDAELTFAAGEEVVTVRSGARGQFALAPTSPATFTLATAEAPGFLPYAPEWQHSSVQLTARPGERVRGLTVFLFPAVDYYGRVVDAKGEPVAGARVRMLGTPTGEQTLSSPATAWTTDRDGAFVFHAQDYAVLEAVAGERRGRASLDGDAQLTHAMLITLGDEPAADGTIAGMVVDDGGAPLPGVLVRGTPVADPAAGAAAPGVLVRGTPVADPAAGAAVAAVATVAGDADDLRAVAFATTDAQGRFTLREIDRGRYDVSASADDRAPTVARAVARDVRDLRLALLTGEPLAGRVTDGTGAAIVAFTLLVFRPDGVARELVTNRSIVDSRGRFSVALPAGTYEVIATSSGWAASAPTTARTGEPVTVTVSSGATVRGQVVSRKDGEPLPYARVMREARSGGASATPANAGTVTRVDGTFELTGIPPGPVALTFAAGGHHPRIEAGLVATDGADLGPVQVSLQPLAPGEKPALELVGIGVKLTPDGDTLRIDAVIPGGGAEAAGLTIGDRFLAIEGTPVSTLGLDGAVALIRGTAGTPVRITLSRPDGPKEVVIVRKAIKT